MLETWIRALRGDLGPRRASSGAPRSRHARAAHDDLQFFESARPERPAAVDRARISDVLASVGLSSFVDDDGDAGLLVRNRVYAVAQPLDDVLQVRGRWNRTAAIENVDAFLEVCHTVNLERVWPTAFVHVSDTGLVVPMAHVTTYLPHGATDEQLATFVLGGLQAQESFFALLDERFPDPIASAP